MKQEPVLLRPQSLYLCPGDDAGAHVTTNSQQCPCGNRFLMPLSAVLERKSTSNLNPRPYEGICADLPTVQRMFACSQPF